jgi:hypothetical protein
VGSRSLRINSLGQHDRQHTGDDGFSICALDIWLLIQVDLEKDRSPLGFEGAKVVFFVWIVGVTEVIVDGYRLNDAFDCLLAECGDTGCS